MQIYNDLQKDFLFSPFIHVFFGRRSHQPTAGAGTDTGSAPDGVQRPTAGPGGHSGPRRDPGVVLIGRPRVTWSDVSTVWWETPPKLISN